MKQKKQGRPALILTAGTLIQLFTGFPSAWGTFRRPVMQEYQLDSQAAGFAANCIVAAYGLGCVIGGFIQDRFGAKAAGLGGSLMLAGGLLAAGFLPKHSPALFYLCFSLPVGLGSAFLYPAVMSCVQKWYAGRKGMAAGVAGLGAGLSGLVLTLVVKYAAGNWGMRVCFWLLAAVTGAVCLWGSLLLNDPPLKTAGEEVQRGMKPGEMVITRQFRLAFFAMAFASPALLLFAPQITQTAGERKLAPALVFFLVAMGSAGAAAGRLIAPLAGDAWDLRKMDMTLFALLTGFSVWLSFGQKGWFALAYVLLCFAYGGQLALMPVLCTKLFGLAHTGINYGFLALGAGCGSLGFPLLARALGLQKGRHWLAVGAALAGLWCIFRIRIPEEENKKSCL